MPQVVVAALTLFGNAVVAVGAIGTAMGFGIGVGALAAGAAVVIGGVMVAKRVMSLFEVEMPTVDTDVSRQRTVKSTTEPQKIIYGEALVSGPISFIGLSGTDNSDLYQTIVLAGHEVTEITDIHMDDVVISNADINGGAAAGGAVGSGSVEFGPKNGTICVINKYKGEASQTADPLFTAAFSTGPASNQYTSAHRGDGIAYLAMKWVLNEDSAETWEKFSPSNVKALVKGKPVYDPRLDTGAPNYNPLNQLFITYNATAGSYVGQGQNPALVLADYLISDLGMGISPSKIDWSSFITAANGCDVSVNVPNNGTEKRFTCNGVLFTTDSHQKNINKILSSMNGNLVYSNGKYIVHAGIYEDETIQEPFETLNEDDLIGAISIKTSLERSDRFNTIKGLFIDPSQNHKSTEFPKVQLADAVARDNDEILEKEVQYPMTNSSYMAQRLSFKLIKLSDQQKIISFPANLSALRITAGDRVKVSIEELSWSDKIFQCVGWNFSEEGGVNLTLREDSESAYDDPVPNANPALSEYSTITATGDITDAFRGVPSPSGLTVTPGLKSNELNWVNPGKTNDFGTIYVYASRNANFSSAIKIGETDGTQFIHDGSNKSLIFFPSVVNVGDTYTIRTLGNTNFVAMGAASNTVGVVFTATATGSGTGNLWETLSPGDLRYYWVRAVKNIGTDDASRSGLEPPNDPNTTVFATVGAVEVDWVNVADPTIGIDINNDTISINTGFANTTTGQAVATSGIEAGTTVTQGGITMNQGGSIKGGQSAYNSGTGFFLGYDTNAYKFSIGNAGNNSLAFDGTNLAVTGAITATSGTFTGTVNASAGVFTGDVSVGTGAIYGGTMSSFNSGSGFFLGYDTGAYKFSVGNSSSKVLTWDGDNLNIQANLVSFTTAKEQVYSSLSRLPPGVVSAARSLGSNSDYFYFDSDIDVIQPSFVVSYKLGALTSGSISGQANSRNAIVSTVKLELFYATASYSGTPGTWTSWRSRTFTSSTLGVGQPSMSDNTIVVRQFDLGGGNWETKLLTREEYREYQEDDYYSPSFTPNNAVDDEYYLNWRVGSSSPTVEWPVGAKFIKVVATITNGSYTPYPSTGSPSTTETRVVSIPGGTLYEHENYGSAIALGGQAWDNATRYIGLSGQTNISGGEIIIGAGIQNPAQVGDTATLKFVGFDEDGGSIRKLSAIEFHNGISTLSGTPDFQIYVPNAGDVLRFAGDVNFNSDVDVDGTLSINGVTVNAGAVTGPAGSNTQVQFNNNGALGASSGFTFNDSNDTLTVSNLTVGGTISSGAITSSGTSAINNFRLTDSSKLGFGTVKAGGSVGHTATVDEGIFWHSNSEYGIYRTSGGWDAPNYQQLKLDWITGIIIDGGSNYGLSGVDIKTSGTSRFKVNGSGSITVAGAITSSSTISSGAITATSNLFLRSAGGDAGIYLQDSSNSNTTAFHIHSDVTASTATLFIDYDPDGAGAGTGWAFVNGGNFLSSGTIYADGAASNSLQWEAGYDYSQVGHLPLAGGTLTGNLTVAKSGSDSLLIIEGDSGATGQGDPVLNFKASGNTIAGEGFQIWYDNSVGDVHLHTTFPNDAAAIRFHTATGTDKATNNERFTINGNGLINIVSGNLAMGGNAVITNDRSLFPTSIEVSGSYSGGSGDYTNITNAQLKIGSAGSADFWRIPHFSTHPSVSGVYNYETGKDVYWGEPTDTGTYYFRGRDLVIGEGVLKIGTATAIDASRNLTIRNITATGVGTSPHQLLGTGTIVYLNIGGATQTQYSGIAINTDDGNAQFFKAGSGYSGWGGADAFNIYNSNGDISFHPSGTANVLQVTSSGIAAVAGTFSGNVQVPAMGIGLNAFPATVGHTAASNEGIFWHTTDLYGVYRTAGAWTHPNYQQLRIAFDTGIELDGGTNYGKSGVNLIRGNFKVGGLVTIDASRNISGNTLTAGDAFRSDRSEDASGTFLFQKGATSGATRHLNLADTTSDPAGVLDSDNPTGITWGQRSDSLGYYLIGLKGSYYNGYSTHSRLRIGWHTGIEIGARSEWGGVRFFADSPWVSSTEVMSVGKGDSHVRIANNLYVTGALASTGANFTNTVNVTNTAAAFVGLDIGSAAQTQYSLLRLNSNSGLFQAWKAGNGYTNWGGNSAMNIYTDFGDLCFHPAANANVLRINAAGLLTTGNVTAYYSDMRLKTKTAEIDNALQKVNSLSGFKYVENDLAKELGYSNDKQQVGLSAQEIQAVLPEAVSLAPIDYATDEHTGEIISKSGENYLTVDYAKLVPLLVEAIKELTQEVEALKTKLKEK